MIRFSDEHDKADKPDLTYTDMYNYVLQYQFLVIETGINEYSAV